MLKQFSVIVLLWLTLTGSAAAKVRIAVSVLPQQYLAEQIGADLVEVQLLVQPGYSPVTYELTPRQLVALATADFYWSIGVPFENGWLPKIRKAYPHLEILEATAGMSLLKVRHDGEDELDPHVWLSPALNLKLAQGLRDRLIELDPAHSADYRDNYRRFSEKIDRLDRQLRSKLATANGQAFLVFHPAWGYFANAYGLRQVTVEHEGKEPGARYLNDLLKHIGATDLRVILVQPQHDSRLAKIISQAINAGLITVDPLSLDYFGEMLRVADILSGQAYKQGKQ